MFVYDDSPMTDHTKAFPVHREEGVPACVGVVTDGLEKDSNLGRRQLHEMRRRAGRPCLYGRSPSDGEATVAEDGLLGAFGGQTYDETLTEDRIRTTIRMAKERDVEIATLHEAFANQGVDGSDASREPLRNRVRSAFDNPENGGGRPNGELPVPTPTARIYRGSTMSPAITASELT